MIGIISVKGGVGKTSCTSNLGSALARMGKKVAIVDANFSAPNLGLHFGIVEPKICLHNVLIDGNHIKEAIYEHNPNLHIIPSKLHKKRTKLGKFKKQINKLRKHYDFILIDSSPSRNREIEATIEASDGLIIVSSPDYPTISMTITAAQEIAEQNKKAIGIVLNRVKNKKFELSKKDIETTIGLPIICEIKEHNKIPTSIAATTPLMDLSPTHKISVEFKKLAAGLIGEEYKTSLTEKIRKIF